MKSIPILLSLSILLIVPLTLIAQIDDTIRIDLGDSDASTPGGWNNLSMQRTGSIESLVNIHGIPTGIKVAVSDAFNGINTAGLAADASLEIPSTASGDSFFGNLLEFSGSTEPSGGITFSNLDVDVPYSFTIFASRSATDNRETKYVATGANTGEALLNVASNTSDIAVINEIMPAPDGSISLIASPGENNNNSYGFFYMGAVNIYFENNYVAPPKSISLISPNGGEIWETGKTPVIRWTSVSVPELRIEYSTDLGVTWNAIASNVPAIDKKYDWTITSAVSDQCLLRLLDAEDNSVGDTSEVVFSIIEDDGIDYEIVVLGSSTAAGTGPSEKDSAWVWMYREHVQEGNTNFSVTNLAVGGFSTYNILPTGYSIPSGVNTSIDSEHNITKALSLYPDAIIINLPSNDAANNYPVEDQLVNYDTISKLAKAFLVPMWVCTPQPRNFSNTADQIQLDMVDSTNIIFGDMAIDFWSEMFEDDGSYDIKDIFDSDGVHLNNAGHKELFSRVIDKDIDTYIENREPGYFTVTPILLNLAGEIGSSGILHIRSDLDWNVSLDDPAFALNISDGIGNGEVEITVSDLPTGGGKHTADITFSPDGLEDFLVSVQFQIVGVEEQGHYSGIRIYPNPVKNILHIENSKGAEFIEIINISGRVLMHISDPDDQMEIDVTGLEKGLYILRCRKDNSIQTLKLIK